MTYQTLDIKSLPPVYVCN